MGNATTVKERPHTTRFRTWNKEATLLKSSKSLSANNRRLLSRKDVGVATRMASYGTKSKSSLCSEAVRPFRSPALGVLPSGRELFKARAPSVSRALSRLLKYTAARDLPLAIRVEEGRVLCQDPKRAWRG